MFCKTKANGTRSRNWTFPDGTTCRSKLYKYNDIAYCIAGRCERFSCDNSDVNYYKIDSIFCGNREQNYASNSVESHSAENRRHSSVVQAVPWQQQQQQQNNNVYKEQKMGRERPDRTERPLVTSKGTGIYGPTTVRSKYENGKPCGKTLI